MIKKFLKTTFIYGVAAVLPKAINVLLVKLHTSVLPPEGYSVNTSFYIWASYFNIILTYGMETSFFRFYQKKTNKYVFFTSFLGLIISCFCVLTPLYCYADTISPLLGFSKTLHFKMLLGIAFFDTLVVIPYAYLRAISQAKKYTFYRILNIIIYGGLNVLLLLFIKDFLGTYAQTFISIFESSGLIFLANIIASVVIFLLMLPLLFKHRCHFDKTLFRQMIRYGFPIMIAGIAYITNENLDKLLMVRFLGKAVMGGYAGAYKIGVFMSLFIMAFRLGAEPFFFQEYEKKDAKKKYAEVMKWFVISGSAVVILVLIFLKEISQTLLGNPAYEQYLGIVPLILIANLFLGIYNNLSAWYKLKDKTKYGMYFSVIGGMTTFILLWYGLPMFGFMVAAWTTLIVYVGMATLSFFYGRRYYDVPYPIGRISVYLAFTTGIACLSFFEKINPWELKIAILLFYLAMVYILEKPKQRTLKS